MIIVNTIFLLMSLFAPAEDIYDFSFTAIDGKTVKLSDFKGKNILIVNTASECGFTKQYKDLQALHERFGDKLVIIGFPANNFGGQEPGDNADIQAFCEKNYGVTFLLSEKVDVKGQQMHPLFKYLTVAENPDFTGDIKWNFEKFLINKVGKLVHRYRSKVNPLDETIIKHIH
ncbi:glutathione peroxidase [Sphingobacterium allocomposti]|jgi:glutathione peroxidase|uniref:Glutathione peroxidase n=1 Tax=Sphingobacterium allocomposti TaxID=415956 RepID=A0A5S5D1Q5_9SPHI|nr:glutathione peroxidase [Sphingobacterium composti Yoo et al. 2007 non Ten et al. 2007]TYP88722.1 glutathione peroxidase [Sphingobacterium composti Yoo et al. 2007 non Ten et al. 2007]